MTLPLEGIRVLDVTHWQHGPAATLMLADLGAEVIKIEERKGGDPSRGMTYISGMQIVLPGNINSYFEALNRNKKSISLDFKNPEAKVILKRLAKKSDVFVHNFRPGVAEKIGLDYETLSQYNPKLIYAAASGYGPLGPECSRPVIDPIAQARTGIMDDFVVDGDSPPRSLRGGFADQVGAVILAYGILSAIIARERFGVAQRLDVSLLASMMWIQFLSVELLLSVGREFPKSDRLSVNNPMANFYRCADGRWIVLSLFQADRFWSDFCKAIGLPELEDNPEFDTAEKRKQNNRELIHILDKVFATKSFEAWDAIFREYRDFLYAPIRRHSDLISDPQVLANEYIVDFDHPVLGRIKRLAPPIKLSKSPSTIRTAAPELGQNTEEVLLDICGYSWSEIAEFKDKQVV